MSIITERNEEKFMKKIAAIGFSTLIIASSAFAAEPKAVIGMGYFTGDGDLKLSGTTYDTDLSGTGFEGRFYLNDNISLTAGMTDQEGDINVSGVVVKIEGETTSFGAQYVFGGRVDTYLGEGAEHRIGFRYVDIETKLSGITFSSDYTDIVYDYSAGLGNGLVGTFSASVDSEEFLDDRAFRFELLKSLTENIGIMGSYEMSKTVVDANNSSETNGFVLGIGLSF
jgi:hypothetical protein